MTRDFEHESWVRPASRVVARCVHGELVLVVLPCCDAIVLNDFGAAVWSAVGEGARIEDVCALLAEGDQEVDRDVWTFVKSLVDEGLLEARPQKP